MMVRKILHLDLDAFFCAVEEQHDPSLRGKAFAVGGRPDERGVVASCSYAARVYGIHSAMPMSRAIRLCPDLLIVSSRHEEYGRRSKRVMRHLHNLTPLVEQISIDEAFLDVTGRQEKASALARLIQQTINEEEGLPCSLGVATSKLVAKIANNVGKSEMKATRPGQPPNAIKVVRPGQEAAFLAPLPVRELWGVGPKTEERLMELGLRTIGDIATCSEEDLSRRFGKHGRDLSRRARGIDERPLETKHETKSVSKETTFAQDIADEMTLKRTLLKLSEGVGRRLRRAGLAGRTVTLKLRWADFTTLTRQITLEYSTDTTEEIYHAIERLFTQTWVRGKAVRLLGVGVSGFDDQPRQLGLWDSVPQDDNRLDDTLDQLRDRFGGQAVRRASDLWLEEETGEGD
jgi:DNA polymerase-4